MPLAFLFPFSCMAIWAGNGYRWDGQQERVVLLDPVAEAAIAPDIPASERPPLFNRSKQP